MGTMEQGWSGLFNPDQNITPPDRQYAQLDSGTTTLMNQKQDRANESTQDIASDMQKGVQQDGGAAFKDMGLMNQGMGGPGNPMMGAIQNRQEKNYLRDVNGIKRQSEYQAPLEQASRMQSVMQDKLAKANVAAGIADRDRQQQLIQYQHDQRQEQLRANIIGGLIGSVFGGVGTGAGISSRSPNGSPQRGGSKGGQYAGEPSQNTGYEQA